ncbi:hypothetical protein O6H91_Y501300 [Diphasiastrum complanatum]|nr:hypothetical protein O6H91_Y501300 [Diphasiastrum complanatum]
MIAMASLRSWKPSCISDNLLHSKARLEIKRFSLISLPSGRRFTFFMLLLCVGSLITVASFRASHNYALHLQVGSAAASKGSSSGAQKNSLKYLYWGEGIDCPGKHCTNCGGLGHQESSLRCALEEALVLNRTFVLPSSICIIAMHNDKGLISRNHDNVEKKSWTQSSCSMEALYDLELISRKVRVILENSREWQEALLFGEQEENAIVQVEGVNRKELRDQTYYRNAVVIKRKASSLAWFVECKDRHNRSAVLLPYSFLPTAAAKPLQMAANKVLCDMIDHILIVDRSF